MPSKKRKRGRMVNTDYSDQEDIPEAEARLLTTELRLAVRMGDGWSISAMRIFPGDALPAMYVDE
ncbi:hypothetical protein T11_8 [Trichinella zimbabwensis]|uniref:Uncharacterized protein n=1 Tax=Trichinella zimbabwensis TaxID=268475 RepID=A0A0V1H3E2_9BILA|nr:hypothetical protein T11_8 [Trichinella zimbabwensis]